MSVKISGVMKDAMGKPIPDCTIALKALHTSATVITKTIGSLQPEENGSYSMDVELGKYSVTLCVEGYPPNDVGEIYVHSESAPGTLNYYLGLPTEGDLPPAAIQQFEAMVALVSKQAAQVEKDKAAAAKSAADALASQAAAKASETNAGKSAGAALACEKAAKTSETNTAKGIEAAAASAQAAKLSETNADGSKKAAQTSAAEALASQGAAKTSETNAGNSAKAASGSADKAKSEADRATTATDGKQDKNALLTAIAALNTAADQIITLTGKSSVATAVLTKFAKDMLAKTDADGVREYLGLKEALKIGDYGLGRGSRWLMSDLGWTSGFLMYNTVEAEVPANACGWQSSYGNSRRAQLVMGTDGRLHARFSLSTEIVDTTTEWRQLLFRWEQTPRFEWGIEVSNKPKDDGSGRIAYLGSNSAPNNAGNGAVYLINRLGNKALQLMDNGTINFDNKDIPVFGQPNVNFGSGFSVSNTQGSQSYVTAVFVNRGRPSTDNGSSVGIEIAHTTIRPYFIQRRNDGTTTGQIVNELPTASGALAIQGTSGRDYKRDIVDADATEALNRINQIRFVNYIYKDDEQNRERFGFIAEEVEQIAPQYIKHMQELVDETLDPDTKEIIDRVYRDRPCIDNNPIVMDLLGAIQVLNSKLNEQETRLLALEKRISNR